MTNADISKNVIRLFDVRYDYPSEAGRLLVETANMLDDDYFDMNHENGLFKEPTFKGDLNTHLKTYDDVSPEHALNLHKLIDFAWQDLRRRASGQQQSRFEEIQQALQ